ncbi:MAG: hypothetical protein U1E07_15640 [Hydrocarboniphaga sp.]|nr:hypothetical protein [Hydrocarboniphaga sp.]MDZ4079834.1 hypothetical protein [Hydrocarboniphaga sp.]
MHQIGSRTAAADQRARGFLLGATAGRTTLGGEGLQHQDGSSHVAFAGVPNCRAYDPAFAYEVAVLLEAGMHEMLVEQQDRFYYLTVGNANYAQPSMPAHEGVRDGILRGLYPLTNEANGAQVQLLGSGAIMTEVLEAQRLLQADWNIAAAVWSATSYSELHRDGIESERKLRHGLSTPAAFVTAQLSTTQGPVIAASDYVRALPELIRAFVPRRYVTLGRVGRDSDEIAAKLS